MPATPKTIKSFVATVAQALADLHGRVSVCADQRWRADGSDFHLFRTARADTARRSSSSDSPGRRRRRRAARSHPSADHRDGHSDLVLTALCVLATMAALAMERREDVGLMKALGGSIARIVANIPGRSGCARSGWWRGRNNSWFGLVTLDGPAGFRRVDFAPMGSVSDHGCA